MRSMKKVIANSILSVVLFALNACVTTKDVIPTNKFQPTATQRVSLKNYLKSSLKDPYSVRDAEISEAWVSKKSQEISAFTKAICVRYNAKNSYGAYIGLQSQMFIMNDDAIVTETGGVEAAARCDNSAWNLNWYPFPELSNSD
jgi:hypothetical protein